MDYRKNFLTLGIDEKQRFIDAIKQLKSLPGTENNDYDRHVAIHRDHFRNGMAHGGIHFLPWHREYLNQFENDLQEIDSDVTLPYWDWTEEAARTPDSSLWADDFMGGTGSPVSTGPFSDWGLRRFLGRDEEALPTSEEVGMALSHTTFSTFTRRFETDVHNNPHRWVGGTMATAESPADPVFWLHHANVDRLWAEWQTRHPEQVHPDIDGSLHPWATTTRDVLDHHQLGYMYDTEPAVVTLQSKSQTDSAFPNELVDVTFDNMAPGETRTEPIIFSIHSGKAETVTLEIVDGPTVTSSRWGRPDSGPAGRFDTRHGTTVSVTLTGGDETEVHLPISYTGVVLQEITGGTVTVRRKETDEEWIVRLMGYVIGGVVPTEFDPSPPRWPFPSGPPTEEPDIPLLENFLGQLPESTPPTSATGREGQEQRLCDLVVFWFEEGLFDNIFEEYDIDRSVFEEGLNRFCKN